MDSPLPPHVRTASVDSRLALAAEATGLGFWEYEIATGELFWSDRTRALYGLAPDAPVTFETYQAGIHPEDRARVLATYQAATAPGADPSYSFEHRTIAPDGTVRWVLAHGRVFFEDGRAVRVAGTSLDITERKRAEERERRTEAALRESEEQFRHLAEALPQIVWVMRPDGAATYFNRRFAEYHGYQAGADIGDRSSNIHPDDKAAVWAGRDAAVAERRPIECDVRLRRHDGAYRWHRMSAVPLKRDDGEVYAYVGTATDIDDMRRAEERQRLLINELNHRVKNTLATVQALAAQTFRDAVPEAVARRTFEARLFALSKVHDTLTRENWEGADLGRIVADALAPYHGHAGRFLVAGPDLRLRPAMALPLAMALHELATNAAKYGALSNEAGRVEIRWSVSGSDDARRLGLSWTERGGPAVAPPQRSGFGTRLIRHGLARELAGEVALAYDPAGVTCRIEAPLPPSDPAQKAAAESLDSAGL
ncbi:MAG TPA: PAS domain-containing protein [Beijerinckiaceae bacterium]